MENYNLVIANDHAGFALKMRILDFFKEKGYKIYSDDPENPHLERRIMLKRVHNNITDLGSYSLTRVDYPDYAQKLVQEIIEGNCKYGILICGTGIGMAIAANRNSSIRAALCVNEFMAEQARAHNDANILVLGSKITEENCVMQMIEKFLSTEFDGGRHAHRINKIS